MENFKYHTLDETLAVLISHIHEINEFTEKLSEARMEIDRDLTTPIVKSVLDLIGFPLEQEQNDEEGISEDDVVCHDYWLDVINNFDEQRTPIEIIKVLKEGLREQSD